MFPKSFVDTLISRSLNEKKWVKKPLIDLMKEGQVTQQSYPEFFDQLIQSDALVPIVYICKN